jgi:hypothetical protein
MIHVITRNAVLKPRCHVVVVLPTTSRPGCRVRVRVRVKG